MNGRGIEPPVSPVLRVRLSGVVRGDAETNEPSVINAPTVLEAQAALDRLARVQGAARLERTGSDYRRTTLAAGPLTTQTLIEVQAWGTAVHEQAGKAEKAEADERQPSDAHQPDA